MIIYKLVAMFRQGYSFFGNRDKNMDFYVRPGHRLNWKIIAIRASVQLGLKPFYIRMIRMLNNLDSNPSNQKGRFI